MRDHKIRFFVMNIFSSLLLYFMAVYSVKLIHFKSHFQFPNASNQSNKSSPNGPRGRHEIIDSSSLAFPVIVKQQILTLVAKFLFNFFVSYFLSYIKRIIRHFSFKTGLFTLYCFTCKICFCSSFVV